MNAHIDRKFLKGDIYIVFKGVAINMTIISDTTKKRQQDIQKARDLLAKQKENREEARRMLHAEANKKRK
jgi:hypothetical protein